MGTPAPVLEPEPSELIEVYGFSDVGLQVGHEDELDDGGTPQPNPDDSVSDSSRID
jgi:hypothetical protein